MSRLNIVVFMKRLFTFLLLVVSIALSQAQNNFKNGYIITNNNDTIWGEIDFRVDELNAQRCKFRQDKNSETKIFLPGEIQAYRFSKEGKYYVSKN